MSYWSSSTSTDSSTSKYDEKDEFNRFISVFKRFTGENVIHNDWWSIFPDVKHHWMRLFNITWINMFKQIKFKKSLSPWDDRQGANIKPGHKLLCRKQRYIKQLFRFQVSVSPITWKSFKGHLPKLLQKSSTPCVLMKGKCLETWPSGGSSFDVKWWYDTRSERYKMDCYLPAVGGGRCWSVAYTFGPCLWSTWKTQV